jgi:ketosteroid isomerase-like protein
MIRSPAPLRLACAAALVFAALSATGCAPRRLPGTEIPDTDDTRAILQVVETYRQAMQRRDAGAVLPLVAPDYFDGAGTPEPADDLDRVGLEQQLPKDLAHMEGLRLDMRVRDIRVEGDLARAEFSFDAYYRVTTPTGKVPRRDTDVHQMTLRRNGPRWLITSGL